MGIRRFLRGRLPRETLDTIAREATDRRGESFESVRPLEADNWLSTPAVVNGQFFLKIISTQNTYVQRVLTTGRNLGAYSSGGEAFFRRFEDPLEMATHELEATRGMSALGVNVPEPLEAFAHGDYGVLVLEFLPAFETLEEVDPEQVATVAPALFDALARMHAEGLAHGDLRGENVLVADGEPYFIDATNVSEEGVETARAYDLACALAVLEPALGAGTTVERAARQYPDEVLLDAEQYLSFVNLRPDYRFDAPAVRGELEKHLQSEQSP